MNDSNFYSLDLLHRRSRATELRDIETHLELASALARALWEALQNDDFSTADMRTRVALRTLADLAADHASAAQFIFLTNPGRAEQ